MSNLFMDKYLSLAYLTIIAFIGIAYTAQYLVSIGWGDAKPYIIVGITFLVLAAYTLFKEIRK